MNNLIKHYSYCFALLKGIELRKQYMLFLKFSPIYYVLGNIKYNNKYEHN